MKKVHLGAVLFSTLLVGVLVIAAGMGGLFGVDTDGPVPGGESPSVDSDSMTAENVSVRNRTAEGVLFLDIGAGSELDMERLESSMKRLYDDPTVNVSAIERMDVRRNVTGSSATPGQQSEPTAKRSVVTVAIVTDDRSSSTHVVNRVEHYLNEETVTEQPDQRAEQTDDSTAEYTTVSPGNVCTVTPAYYQVDFVVGDPIEQLQGPEGTYLPHELIRFAHGSTEEPIVRHSGGEFITDPELSERIESQSIEVENGMATVTFSVAEGAEPITLSLVSYTKPAPGWSRATEHRQEFVDADTKTFEAGGSYTLRVALPEAETGRCKTPEPKTTTTAMPTHTPIETVTVEPQPSTQTPTGTPPPAEIVALQLSRPVQLEVDWLSVYNGGRLSHRDTGSTPQAIFSLNDVKPGDEGKAIIRLHNRAGPSYIRMAGELTANDENGANEPERDAEDNPGGAGDGELAEKVDVTVYYAEHTGPGNYDVEKKQVITSGSLAEVMADLNNGIALDSDPDTNTRNPYPRHEIGSLVFEWSLPYEVGNEVQSDSGAFSLEWVAQQAHSNGGSKRNSNDN